MKTANNTVTIELKESELEMLLDTAIYAINKMKRDGRWTEGEIEELKALRANVKLQIKK